MPSLLHRVEEKKNILRNISQNNQFAEFFRLYRALARSCNLQSEATDIEQLKAKKKTELERETINIVPQLTLDERRLSSAIFFFSCKLCTVR